MGHSAEYSVSRFAILPRVAPLVNFKLQPSGAAPRSVGDGEGVERREVGRLAARFHVELRADAADERSPAPEIARS